MNRPSIVGCFLVTAVAWGQADGGDAPTSNEERIAELTQQVSQTHASLLSLQNLKLSGYVQARYQYADNSNSGLDAQGTPQVKDGFTVRRGRLKASYSIPHTKLVLQIDATPKGVALKDAEVHFIEPWTGHALQLVAGQTKWPFGYEVLQSSSEREFPERSRVVRAFAPGERDRGAKLLLKEGPFRALVGVFDGNGTDNRPFSGVDNDTEKDVIGRMGLELAQLSGGVSGWWGKSFNPSSSRFVPRTRLGADAQTHFTLLPFGATTVKAELIAGRTYQSSGVERFDQPGLGWYALLTQKIGEANLVAVRYDYFDGYSGTPDAADVSNPSRPASTNAVGTVGVLAARNVTSALKVTAAYEMPLTFTGGGQAQDPTDNLFTLQFQGKF